MIKKGMKHRRNMQWIYDATAHQQPDECLELFRDNPVIRSLICECYPDLRK